MVFIYTDLFTFMERQDKSILFTKVLKKIILTNFDIIDDIEVQFVSNPELLPDYRVYFYVSKENIEKFSTSVDDYFITKTIKQMPSHDLIIDMAHFADFEPFRSIEGLTHKLGAGIGITGDFIFLKIYINN